MEGGPEGVCHAEDFQQVENHPDTIRSYNMEQL
jgi:hypothetical protein